MNNGLISIIVPIYKIESYLNKCIESILNQTYSNLEVILVNDGSPDKCGEICNSWAKKDSRIQVLHVENGGAGKARNIGASYANGDFFAFIDGDDYLSEEMFECLINSFSDDIDIVECEMLEVFDDSALLKWGRTEKAMLLNTEEALKSHINNQLFKQTPCNKLYRRRVVENISFPVGKKIDDEFWTYQVISRARKLVHIETKLYAYRQHENSVMHSVQPIKRLNAIEALEERHNFILEKFPALRIDSIRSLWLSCIYQTQLVMRIGDKNEKMIVKEYIKTIIKKYPITIKEKLGMSIKEAIWFTMASISLEGTCKLRNILKIGL